MFLARLTETQRRCFLNLANRVILADWLVPPGEESLLMELARELGPNVTVDAKSLWGRVDLECFHETRTRVLLVFELYLVAQADDSISRGEDMIIADVARELALSEAERERLRALAHEWHVVKRARLPEAEMLPRRAELEGQLGLV